MTRIATALSLAVALSLPAFAAVAPSSGRGTPNEVDLVQPCSALQPINDAQSSYIGTEYAASNFVWNGREYAAVIVQRLLAIRPIGSYFYAFYLQPVFADGQADGSMIFLFSDTRAPATGSLQLAWNGSAFGLVWAASATSNYDVAFARIVPDATNRWTAASHYDLTSGGASGAYPRLAAGSEGFMVAYRASSDIRWLFTLLDASGAVVSNGGTQVKDKPFYSGTTCPAGDMSLAWSPWRHKYVAGLGWAASSTSGCASNGSVTLYGVTVTGDAGWFRSEGPQSETLASGSVSVVATPFHEAFSYVAGSSLYIASATSLTNGKVKTTDDSAPQLFWNGSEYLVLAWESSQGWSVQRVDSGFHAVGAATPIETGSVALGERGLLGWSWGPEYYGALTVRSYGCAAPDAPSCPEGVGAYGVTASGATLSWLPSSDVSTDIAYYEVTNNGALVSRQAGTTLPVAFGGSGAETFYVRAYNAAGLASTGCAGNNAVIVAPTAQTATLTVTKSGADVKLSWGADPSTPSSVWRGTTAQVLTKRGSSATTTFADAGAAVDGNIYFYSIDAP